MSKCELCGEPMPPGEEVFKFHGYNGPCPKKPPLPEPETPNDRVEGRAAITPHDFVEDCDCEDCSRQARDKLRAFARAVMSYWPEGAPDGGDLQELAEKHGLLKPETRHEPCGDGCSCAEYVASQEWESGVICYRRTALMMGSNA